MDNIADVLAKRNYQEPAEIGLIKKFVNEKYDENVDVKIEQARIIISAKNSSLAGTLRMDIPQIQKICETDKRIAIYIN